ncbi:MAG: hypothetical protein WAU16_06580, partial [Rhizobiaceae bacterium]
QELAPATVDSTLVASIGASFDRAGSRREMATRHAMRVSGWFASDETVYLVDHAGNRIVDHAGNQIIVATALGWLRGQVENLSARVGQRGTLWRKRWDATSVRQWKTARLLSVNLPHDYTRRLHVVECECRFESTMAAWRAATATTTSGSIAGAGYVGLTVSNGGQVQVDDAVLTITATAAISSVRVECTAAGISLAWAGSLGAGSSLVIDAGAKTVRNAGADAYSGFSLEAGHTADGWLPLAKGITPMMVYLNAAGAVSLAHYNQFL